MSRVSRLHAGCRASLSALLASGVACADDVPLLADHIVPIEVRQFKSADINTIFIDVKVCDAALSCRTVPNVIVDTGSTGLHLYRKALDGLELDAVTAPDGRPLSRWAGFGSRSMWTTVNRARVRIGNISTDEISIALYDEASPLDQLPAEYMEVDSRDWFVRLANGILGISPSRHADDGYFVDLHGGKASSKPDWRAVLVDPSLQLANPIGHFPVPYNNGSVIKLFGVGAILAYPKLQGWLGLGIGMHTYSLFPDGGRVISHELDADGRFPLVIGERSFDVIVDSGTNAMALDLDHLGFTRRGNDDFWRYVAPTPTPVELTAMFGKRKIGLAQPLYVGPADSVFWGDAGYAAVPALVVASKWAGGINTLGSPFFYGRTVATGLHDSVNPFRQPGAVEGLSSSVVHDEDLAPHSPSPHGFIAYTDGA